MQRVGDLVRQLVKDCIEHTHGPDGKRLTYLNDIDEVKNALREAEALDAQLAKGAKASLDLEEARREILHLTNENYRQRMMSNNRLT